MSMDKKEQEGVYSSVPETTITFKTVTDRQVMTVTNQETNEVMVEISGYDLQINFNMDHLKSVEEIEAAKSGIGELFGKIIVETLISSDKQSNE